MVKMVRLFTCLLAIFFIFFASVPVSYASFEKNPLQFEFTELTLETNHNGSLYASGYVRWGNVSPYKLLDLHGKLDLYNSKGEKINIDSEIDYFYSTFMDPGDNELGTTELVIFNLVPSVTKASDIAGAYIKPTYTFTLGKKAELSANLITETLTYGMSEDKLVAHALILNQGEATATNFKYAGLSFTDTNGMIHIYPETSHATINSSLRLEPGKFVRLSFEVPIDFIDSKFKNYNDIKKISISYTHDNSAPYKDDSPVSVTVNNKKLVQQTFVENDVTYVSLRELADVLGATIQWNDLTQTATLIQRDKIMEYDRQIVIPVGSDRFINDGFETTVSGKAKLYNNTILVVPVRDVANMLDCNVVFEHKWGQKTIIVIPYNLIDE
ncbi:copper amine oxidase N-terminal domain-containing protein [Brevibacillus sp. BC25]|uniref:copper amine oxidase N-terminal domain-containing protein n=1 Tax=Brevibacillus sp. BC25 TaxID=1144308 RepID=UPI000270DE2A|nr:copper amine oxidase N-terminal domain-containing protein [Brevibacillus sp. BC25]EJL24358.1 copper amine oxidase family protein [Brevibacillus sp. BC25]